MREIQIHDVARGHAVFARPCQGVGLWPSRSGGCQCVTGSGIPPASFAGGLGLVAAIEPVHFPPAYYVELRAYAIAKEDFLDSLRAGKLPAAAVRAVRLWPFNRNPDARTSPANDAPAPQQPAPDVTALDLLI